jgi:MOSC domain-containing protein YiiM
MRVLSVNAAAVGELFVARTGKERRVLTGIHKRPVQGAVFVGPSGLIGDEQADLRLHGGPDKAVYAYPFEHYPFWAARRLATLKREVALPPGSMGENLTLQGLLECDVWAGDCLHIGDVICEVTEPRSPCFKFNAKMGFTHAAKMMIQAGNSGFYLRVMRPGALCAGDAITLVPGPRAISIAHLNEQRRMGRQHDLF